MLPPLTVIPAASLIVKIPATEEVLRFTGKLSVMVALPVILPILPVLTRMELAATFRFTLPASVLVEINPLLIVEPNA